MRISPAFALLALCVSTCSASSEYGAGKTVPTETQEPPGHAAAIGKDGPGDAGPGDSGPSLDARRRLPVLSEIAPTWYDKAEALADRETIGAAFERQGYRVPEEAYLLIGRISKINGRPAYTWFSLRDTGFVQSADSFWPASMIKLVAAVGALETLADHGLDGSTRISFTDGRGRWSGTASRLYASALTHSNNVAYDRLMKIAGFDALNDRLLTPKNGFPFMTFQRAYDANNDETLRVSPEIAFEKKGGETGVIPRRESAAVHEACPDEGNCATLFELLHFLQRVVLHDEIEEGDRFRLTRVDRRALARYLEAAPSRIGPGIEAALGHEVTIYNKGGRVPDLVANDHALVVDETNSRHYLVAASIAERDGKDETKARIAELVRRGLRAVAFAKGVAVPAAVDGGAPIEIAFEERGEDSITLRLSAGDADVDELVLYDGTEEIGRGGPEGFEATRPIPGIDPRVFVAIATKGSRLVGYASLGLAMR